MPEHRHHAQLLRTAAEAVRASMAGGALPDLSFAEAFRDVLLAENADRSEEAAARCRALRSTFAAAVRRALAEMPETSSLVAGGVGLCGLVPPVHVEVRGTAGRRVSADAFLIGASPECDVQPTGDPTVQPLQWIVVPLPGGIVVVNFWSGGDTRAAGSRSSSQAEPCQSGAAFIVAPGERTLLQLGAQTTITLGPSASSLDEALQRTRRANAVAQQRLEASVATAAAKIQAMSGSSATVFARSTSDCGSLFSDQAESPCSSRSRSPSSRLRL